MANPQHVKWLLEGVEAWNARRLSEDFTPDLDGADIYWEFRKARKLGRNGRIPLAGINLGNIYVEFILGVDPNAFYHEVVNPADFYDFPDRDMSKWSDEVIPDRESFPSAQLSGANLTFADLTRSNLTGAILAGAKLVHANFTGAYLSYANLSDADLRGSRLINADLRGASIERAEFFHADLTKANLKDAKTSGANLIEANLNGANWAGAELWKAILYPPNMSPKQYSKQ